MTSAARAPVPRARQERALREALVTGVLEASVVVVFVRASREWLNIVAIEVLTSAAFLLFKLCHF